MSLVESWRKIAQLNLSATSPLDNNNARGFGMALASAAADLEAACTPRPPQPEWFGTGPGQWDTWWIKRKGENKYGYAHNARVITVDWSDEKYALIATGESCVFSLIESCVPVAREGFSAPVGWHVVGG